MVISEDLKFALAKITCRELALCSIVYFAPCANLTVGHDVAIAMLADRGGKVRSLL